MGYFTEIFILHTAQKKNKKKLFLVFLSCFY